MSSIANSKSDNFSFLKHIKLNDNPLTSTINYSKVITRNYNIKKKKNIILIFNKKKEINFIILTPKTYISPPEKQAECPHLSEGLKPKTFGYNHIGFFMAVSATRDPISCIYELLSFCVSGE